MKTYEGKSMAKGGGGRFEQMKDAIMRKPGMTEERAAAITAAAGRKKYGKTQFQRMAATGRRRAARKSNMPTKDDYS